MTLRFHEQITDTLDDEVGRCLRRLHAIPTWTAEKVTHFEELVRLCKRECYLRFTGDYRDYHLERKGQSCLYGVPVTQRGALERYRGKRVRLICEGGWNPYSGRYFLAKPVSQTPTDHALSKRGAE